MKTGIIGLERSGKTTVFNALTGQNKEVDTFGKIEANIAVIKVPDERVDFLSDIYKPKRTQLAEMEFLDIPGSINNTSDPKILACAREADALCLIIRDFRNDVVSHPLGGTDPERDLREILTGLILADMEICEKRIVSLNKRKKKGITDDGENIELSALEKVLTALERAKPASDAELTSEEKKRLRSFQLLTMKSFLTVLNTSEENINDPRTLDDLKCLPNSMPMAARLEGELRELDPEERTEFMADLGIKELSLERFIRKAYATLGLISFFTAGEKQVKAWTIKKGLTVQQAAGKIHSDMERGFIQAEVFSWRDIKEHESEREIKKQGLLRTEGKKYIVQDGDILNIKFNV